MSEFLEERFPVTVKLGASYEDDYNVEITRTSGGKEYRKLVHPFPERRFTVSFSKSKEDIFDDVLGLYHRVYGRYAGFRVKAIDDWSTNGMKGVPSATDQLLSLVSAGVYQLRKEYGISATGLVSIGRPFRTIFKPVSGTVLVAIRNSITGDHTQSAITADATTGRVTFAANKAGTITGISQAASAVISIGAHSFVVGDSAHISGVSGMTQINGRRAAVTAIGATDITVAINSTGFGAWTSGGTVNTRPQAGEEVRGGCEFDIPCRFDSAIGVTPRSTTWADTDSISLIELIDL